MNDYRPFLLEPGMQVTSGTIAISMQFGDSNQRNLVRAAASSILGIAELVRFGAYFRC